MRTMMLFVLMLVASATAFSQEPCTTVKPGDGFIKIAQRCGVSPKELIAANRSQKWFRNRNYLPQDATVALPGTVAVSSVESAPNPYATPANPDLEGANKRIQKDLLETKERLSAALKEKEKLLEQKNQANEKNVQLEKENQQLREQLADARAGSGATTQGSPASNANNAATNQNGSVRGEEPLAAYGWYIAIGILPFLVAGLAALAWKKGVFASKSQEQPAAGINQQPAADAEPQAVPKPKMETVDNQVPFGKNLEPTPTGRLRAVTLAFSRPAKESKSDTSEKDSEKSLDSVPEIEAEIARLNAKMARIEFWVKLKNLYFLRGGKGKWKVDARVTDRTYNLSEKVDRLRRKANAIQSGQVAAPPAAKSAHA